MLPLLENKIVFISGGSQGLGAAIARAAVRERAEAVVGTVVAASPARSSSPS